MWEESLGYDGKPTKNRERHTEYVEKRLAEKRKARQMKKGQKGKKLNF